MAMKRFVTCDVCEGEVEQGDPMIFMDYPFSTEELEQMIIDISERNPIAHQFLGLMPLPSHHRFHFHKRCADQFLPMADAWKALAIERARDEWMKARERVRMRAQQEG